MHGWVTLEVVECDGRMVCGIYKLEGKSRPGPGWYRAVRDEMHRIEQIARDAGCAEMRVSGRNWSRVLKDYQPIAGLKNGLGKAL